MDARITKENDLLPFRNPSAEEVEARRLAALRSQDVAIGRRIGGAFAAVGSFLGGIVQFLAIYPQRRAVFDQLNALSDRELADIGLERSDIARVFDPGFVMPNRSSTGRAATVQPVVGSLRTV